jgi:hypothetical protein
MVAPAEGQDAGQRDGAARRPGQRQVAGRQARQA